MATAFPAGLDSFNNPTALNNMNDAAVLHSSQHSNLNDAVAAIQAKMGIVGSAVVGTLEKRLSTIEVANFSVQSGVLAASTTAAPNATAVMAAIAAGTGGAALPTVATTAIPLDIAGAGRRMPLTADTTYPVSTNTTLTIAAGAIDDGLCVFDIMLTAALAYPAAVLFSGDALTTGFKYRLYIFKILGDVQMVSRRGAAVVPAAPTVTAGTNTSSAVAGTLAPGAGLTPASYTLFYKTAAAPSYTTGATVTYTGASTPFSIPGLVSATSYNVKAQANNTNGASADSAVVTSSTAAAPAGNISVSIVAQTADDLTALGYLDYIAFDGSQAGGADRRKATGNLITGPALTNMARTGGGSASPAYSWTDANIGPTGSLIATGGWGLISTASNGTLDFVVPAGVGVKRARILVGLYTEAVRDSTTRLIFSLSDGSFGAQTVTPAKTFNNFITTYYEVTYNAGSAAQTLQIRFEELSAGVVGIGSGMCVRIITYGN